jgi:hypothetical protein
MNVGDLVELKKSVLSSGGSNNYLGIIIEKAHNAVKVEWFNKDSTDHHFPRKNQFKLKLKVVAKL